MFNFEVYCCLVFLEYDYGNVNKKTGSVLVAVIGQSVRAGNAGGVSDQFQGLCFYLMWQQIQYFRSFGSTRIYSSFNVKQFTKYCFWALM